MACKKHGYRPGNTTYNIVKHKLLSIHFYNTGNNGCKGADDGQKPCYYDGACPVFFIKIMRLFQVPFFKKEAVFSFVKGWAAFKAKPIANGIAQNTTDNH